MGEKMNEQFQNSHCFKHV